MRKKTVGPCLKSQALSIPNESLGKGPGACPRLLSSDPSSLLNFVIAMMIVWATELLIPTTWFCPVIADNWSLPGAIMINHFSMFAQGFQGCPRRPRKTGWDPL